MRTEVSETSRIGVLTKGRSRVCSVALALGLAALLGVLLVGAQPSAAQVPDGVPKSPGAPGGTPPEDTPTVTLTATPPEDTPTVTATVTVTLTATMTATATRGTPRPTPTCPLAWGVVSSPNSGSGSNHIMGVAAVSASDVWVVGYSDNGRSEQTLIQHWDGSRWSTVPSPDLPGSYYSELYGVAAVSAGDVWAVGEYSGGTLVEHWNGSSWSVVPSPNPPSAYGNLRGVAAKSASDVWAVGGYYANRAYQTLVEHWNGSSWSIVASPSPGTSENVLNGVAAVSANNVWAVGEYYNSGGTLRTLVERWNGSSWSVVSSPSPDTSYNVLLGVAAVSANNVWAVGTRGGDTLIERWNGSSWSVVSSPNPGFYGNELRSVAAVSGNNVWAVGDYYNSGSRVYETLVERWNGSSWSIVPSPSPGTDDHYLYGVAAVSANDAWAVGEFLEGSSGAYQGLVERWNGSSWSVVYSPNISSASDHLEAVAAISANDVWAVGYLDTGGSSHTLIEHWDGSGWSVVSSPNPSEYFNRLYGVAAVSANDVWAVGEYGGGALVERWNGSSWSVVPSSDPLNSYRSLRGVAAVSAADVWAVGDYYDSSSSSTRTLVEHWNGSSWSVVPSPNRGADDNRLSGVAAVSATDVWAVGYTYDSNGLFQTLIEHWNGSGWSVVPSPSPDVGLNALFGVAAVSATDVWAVGQRSGGVLVEHWNGSGWSTVAGADAGVYDYLYGVAAVSANNVWAVGGYEIRGGGGRTLVEHWNGSSWGVVLSPNPASSGNELYGVAAVSANDVWAVGDHYEASGPYQTLVERFSDFPFSDVHVEDFFYEPVRYLYCHLVISGYGDATFRPYNLTTRGQFCKIAVLAMGWSIYTPPTPTFRDVPETDPFYTVIETAYSHGIISGYGCGAGCLEFRPGNNVTRGQVCKIVVLAKGWALYTPPVPTFRDVADTHTFYPYIETAYSYGIISGYGCGAGCLEFRPGNNATRGQLCKIVYQAVTQP